MKTAATDRPALCCAGHRFAFHEGLLTTKHAHVILLASMVFLLDAGVPAAFAQTAAATQVASGAPPRAARALSKDAAAINQLFRNALKPGEPGMAVIVVRMGQSLHRAAYGMANLEFGVAVEGDTLTTRATGQSRLEIFPSSATEFFLKAVDAPITFVKDTSGTATQLVLHQGGRGMPAKKTK